MANTKQGFKKYDNVWCFKYGWGKVVQIDTECIRKNEYKFGGEDIVIVRFNMHDKEDGTKRFYEDGREGYKDLCPTLFFDEIEIKIPNRPIKLERGDFIEVWTENGASKLAYFVKNLSNGGLLISDTSNLLVDNHAIKKDQFINKI